jgi:hypothetical protein
MNGAVALPRRRVDNDRGWMWGSNQVGCCLELQIFSELSLLSDGT